jgi:hypothetical protein
VSLIVTPGSEESEVLKAGGVASADTGLDATVIRTGWKSYAG